MKTSILISIFLIPFFGKAQKTPCHLIGTADNIPYQDTIINLPKGSIIKMNKCEYFDLRDCIIFKELFNLNDLTSTNITTQDADNNPLQTFGMLTIDFEKDCEKIDKFQYPITVNIPCEIGNITTDKNTLPNFYFLQDGRWIFDEKTKIAKTTINNKCYYTFTTLNCFQGANCDIPFNCGKKNKVKFKVKEFKHLTSISFKSPNGPQLITIENTRKNNKIKIPVCSCDIYEATIEANGTNKNNVEIKTNNVSILNLKHGFRKRKHCKTNLKNIIKYKKYKIKL